MDNLNPLRIGMMQYFNWSKVGTLFYQSLPFLNLDIESLVSRNLLQLGASNLDR